MSKMHVSDKKTGHQMSIHSGDRNDAPKPPSGYSIKGKPSVNSGAERSGTAPTPKTLGGRDVG